jgi:hypothetical protein
VIELGLPEKANHRLRRVGPPVAGTGPVVFVDAAAHDVAIGTEQRFGLRHMVVMGRRKGDGKPKIHVNCELARDGERDPLGLVSEATLAHWSGPSLPVRSSAFRRSPKSPYLLVRKRDRVGESGGLEITAITWHEYL